MADARSSMGWTSMCARVRLLTTFDDDEALAGMLRAGASGFVLNGVPAADLQQTVRVVAEGGAVARPERDEPRPRGLPRGACVTGSRRRRPGGADRPGAGGARPDRCRTDERRDRR
jgi:hypothetical protein